MIQFNMPYGKTDRASITATGVITIGTVIPANTVSLNLGSAGTMSGENKLKKAAKAREQLLDRIRNVLAGSVAGRVEAYAEGSLSTFAGNTTGLSNDAFVSVGYAVADADSAQATELIAGALEALLREAKSRMYAGALALKP